MPVLPPHRNATIPEARRLSIVKGIKRLAVWVAWALLGIAFIGCQVYIGTFVQKAPTALPLFITALIIVGMLTLAGRDKRWQVLLLTSALTLMTGQAGLYFGSWGASTGRLEFIASILFTCFVLFDSMSTKRAVSVPTALIVLMFFYVGFVIASAAVQPSLNDPKAPLTAAQTAIMGISYLLAGFFYFDRWEKIRSFLRFFLGFGVFFALWATVEYLFPTQFYPLFLKAVPSFTMQVQIALSEHRVFGVFHNPANFATFLNMFIPLATYCVIFNKGAKRAWSIGMVLLLLASVFFTGTRSAFLAAFIGFTVFPRLMGNKKLANAMLLGVIMVAVTVKLAGPIIATILPDQNLISRLTDTRNRYSTLTETRVKAWKDALSTWDQHKLLGVGVGQYQSERMKSASRETRSVSSPYGAAMNALVDTGALGGGTLILLWILSFGYGLRSLHNTPSGSRRGLVAALLTVTIVIHLSGLSEVGYGLSRISYFYWLCTGLLLKAQYVSRDELQPAQDSSAVQVSGFKSSRPKPSSSWNRAS